MGVGCNFVIDHRLELVGTNQPMIKDNRLHGRYRCPPFCRGRLTPRGYSAERAGILGEHAPREAPERL